MTTSTEARAAFLAADKRDIEDAAATWSNHTFSSLDGDGDIFIDNPSGNGRWLNDADLVAFYAWCAAQ